MTTRLIAPIVRDFGTRHQRDLAPRPPSERRELLLPAVLRAGGRVRPRRARRAAPSRDGDSWVVNGQKVWSSGAQFAEWGLLIARTDSDAPKHVGLTAFLVPMDSPGIDVRPIRQMSGGASFNEVFLTDVRVPDRLRLGDVGAGWKVGLTTLGYERDHSDSGGSSARTGGTWEHVLASARARERTDDPVVRQAADAAVHPPSRRGLREPASRGPPRRRRGRRSGGIARQAPLDRGDAEDVLTSCRCCSAPSSWPTADGGAPTSGPSTSSAHPAIASPAVPTRSSATSSASACSVCRPNHVSTRTSLGARSSGPLSLGGGSRSPR